VFHLSGSERGANLDVLRQSTITEVLELGEMLFDAALDVAIRQPTGSEEADVSLIVEMRTAAEEFFTALRLLLETSQPSPSSEISA
jgi:hypothetical protein